MKFPQTYHSPSHPFRPSRPDRSSRPPCPTLNRSWQKEQTHASLLRIAYDLLSLRGFQNTRMSDIALAANVSHGAVFAHFKTQEALFCEVIETYGGQLALRIHEAAAACIHMEDILETHLAAIYEFEPFYARLAAEASLLPGAARDVWIGIQSAVSFHFAQVAEREIKAGRCIDIPTWMLFNTWIGLLHHYLANSDLFAPDSCIIERYGSELVKYFVRMIQADSTMENESKDYCLCCARPDDFMQSCPEKLEGTAEFLIRTLGLDKDAAHRMADRPLARLPIWADQKIFLEMNENQEYSGIDFINLPD